MAVETAEHFLERLEREHSLRNQLNIVQPRSTEQLIQFAQSKGFIISEADLKAALAKHPSRLIKL